MRNLFRLQSIYTRTIRAVRYTGLSVLVLIVGSFLALQLPGVQNWIGQQVMAQLSQRLGTTLTVEDVRFGFFEANIKALTVLDQEQDTLAYLGDVYLQYNVLALLQRHIDIRQLRLRDGRINLNRQAGDANFNYQFIADALQGDETDTTSTQGRPFTFEPPVIDFYNLSLTYDDKAGGTYVSHAMQHLHLHTAALDLANNRIDIRELVVEQPITTLRTFAGTPAAVVDTSTEPDQITTPSDTTNDWNLSHWALSIEHLLLSDGSFQFDNTLGDTGIVSGLINWDDLGIAPYTLDINDIRLTEDTLFATFNTLSLQEQSGFRLDTLHAIVSVAPDRIILDDLLLATPQSRLSDSIHFTYRSLADFGDFINKVRLEAHLDSASVNIGDIAYFAPGIPLEKATYLLDGKITGKVSSLRGQDLRLRYGRYTDVLTDLSIYGLPSPDETFIDLSIHSLQTTAAELETMLPFVTLPPQARMMGVVAFTGNFTGFLQDFVAYGDLSSAMGQFAVDINMNLAGPIATYQGNLQARDFQLGKWFNEPAAGKASFRVSIDGQGLSATDMDATISGKVKQFDLFGYQYTDIDFDGRFVERRFDGNFDIDDPNLRLTFAGKIDLSEEQPLFNLSSKVDMANLTALNVTDENLRIRTHMEAAFSGLDIDNLIGAINLKQTEVYYNNRFYPIGNVSLESENYELGKRITLESTLANGMIDGRFKVSELAPTFLGFLSAYYPSVLNYTSAREVDQDFFFMLDIRKQSQLLDLLIPGIEGLAGTSLAGNFNSTAHRLIARLNLPHIAYEGFTANEANLYLQSNPDTLFFDVAINELILPNGLAATHHIGGSIQQDRIGFLFEVYEDSLLNELFTQAEFTNKGDSLSLRLLSSRLILAGEQWNIDKSNEIRYYDGNIYATGLELQNGEQQISITSTIDVRNQSDITIDLSRVSLEDILSIVQYDDYLLQGGITGKVHLNDLLTDNISAQGDLFVDHLILDGDTIGDMKLLAGWDLASGHVTIQNDLVAYAGGQLQLKGRYALYDEDQALNFRLITRDAPFAVVEPFLVGVASDLAGTINGDVMLHGSLDNPVFKGSLTVYDAQATVDYLGTTYYFDPIPIDFSEKSIFVKKTRLRDRLDGNISYADMGGEIWFRDFTDFTFQDFYIYTQPNFRFMQTTREENDLFYGKAFGKAIVLINGPFDKLDLYVNAKSDPGTEVFIPIVYGTTASEYDFIQFVDHSADSAAAIPVAKSYTGMNLVMDLDVTPDASMELIFNEQTGEIIRGRGKGAIKIAIDMDGNFNMYGDVTIEEGDYLFRLQDVISKKFIIEKGGTISWTGDPYDAMLDLRAIYRRKVARFDLVSDLEDQLSSGEIQSLRRPVDVDLALAMKGSLNAPDIAFDIAVANQDNNLTSVFTSRLQEVKSNETELNKQVFGLIMFNRFLPPELSASAAGGQTDILTTGATTLTEFVTNQLNIYFNDWLSRYDMTVNLDYRSYDMGEETDLSRRNELELELNKKIGRLTINVGGNFDFGANETAAATTNNLYGDFSLEYSITEDGRIRVRGFRETDYDIFAEDYRGRAGVGVSFRKDFDRFSELFAPRPADEQAPEEVTEVKATSATQLADDNEPLPVPEQE